LNCFGVVSESENETCGKKEIVKIVSTAVLVQFLSLTLQVLLFGKESQGEIFFIMRGNGCHDLLPFLKSSECGSFKINRLPSFFAGSQEKVIQEAIEGTR
jgi:hypothetical protein